VVLSALSIGGSRWVGLIPDLLREKPNSRRIEGKWTAASLGFAALSTNLQQPSDRPFHRGLSPALNIALCDSMGWAEPGFVPGEAQQPSN
jgi:hypothetical protein